MTPRKTTKTTVRIAALLAFATAAHPAGCGPAALGALEGILFGHAAESMGQCRQNQRTGLSVR